MISHSFQNVMNIIQEQSAWVITMQLHSREQAIKVAAYLAKCIDKKQIVDKGLLLGVWGGFLSGKSLIMDAFAMGLIDDANPYKVSQNTKMFLEDFNGQAASKAVMGTYEINGSPLVFSFRNMGDIRPNMIKENDHRGGIRLFSFKCSSCGDFNINFDLAQRSRLAQHFDFGILIAISNTSVPRDIWSKEWSIHIAPELRTPEMRKALDHLRGVNERIGVRVERNQFAEPA